MVMVPTNSTCTSVFSGKINSNHIIVEITLVRSPEVTNIISNILKQTKLTRLSLRSSRASISWYPSARSSSTASSITAAAISFVISRILQIWISFEKDETSFKLPLINYIV